MSFILLDILLTDSIVKYRAVGGSTGGQAGTGGSAFERNCESKEEQLSTVLKRSLPGITYLSVQDISGGCGAMFEVYIYSSTFYMLPVKYMYTCVHYIID